MRAVARRRVLDELRVLHRGGIDAHLVGAGVEQRRTSSTLRTPPPTVSGMKTCAATASITCTIGSRSSAGGDVEEGELVGALLVVAARDLHRIAGVAQADEVDAFHHAPAGDIETGNDALGEAHSGNE